MDLLMFLLHTARRFWLYLDLNGIQVTIPFITIPWDFFAFARLPEWQTDIRARTKIRLPAKIRG